MKQIRHDFQPTKKGVYRFSVKIGDLFTIFYHVIESEIDVLDGIGSNPFVKNRAFREEGSRPPKPKTFQIH